MLDAKKIYIYFLADSHFWLKTVFTDNFNEFLYYYIYKTDLHLKEKKKKHFPSGSQVLEMIHFCLSTAAIFFGIHSYAHAQFSKPL